MVQRKASKVGRQSEPTSKITTKGEMKAFMTGRRIAKRLPVRTQTMVDDEFHKEHDAGDLAGLVREHIGAIQDLLNTARTLPESIVSETVALYEVLRDVEALVQVVAPATVRWHQSLDDYQRLVALSFKRVEDCDEAIIRMWTSFDGRLPYEIADEKTIIVPKEALQYFGTTGLGYRVSSVISMADLPAARAGELRRQSH